MSKLYFCNPARLGHKLAQEVAGAKAEDPFYPVVVLVDSNLAGVHLRRVLAERNSGHCQVRFMTLKDIAQELSLGLVESSLYENLPFYGEEWAALITAGKEGLSGYFKPVAESRGFSKVLLQLFRELEEHNLQQVPAADDNDPDRVKTLQFLFDSFKEKVSPFYRKTDYLRLASEAIPPDNKFKLIICGLYELQPLEKTLVRKLISCRELETVVLWQQGAERFKAQQDLLRWYEQCGLKCCSLKGEQEDRTGRVAEGTNLVRLQDYLFTTLTVSDFKTEIDGTVKFISAPDEMQEINEISREIIKLARAGVPFRDTAVLVPNQAYAYQCAASFQAVDIPYSRSSGLPLSQTRIGRSLLMLLGLAGSDYPRRQVLELLAYAPLRIYKDKADYAISTVLWDQITVRAGIIKGRNNWLKLLNRYREQLVRGESAEQDNRVETRAEELVAIDSLLNALGLLEQLTDEISSCRNWSEVTRFFEELLENQFEAGPETAIIKTSLKQLSFLDRFGEKFGFKAIRLIVEDVLKDGSLPQGRFQRSGVNIVNIQSAAGLQFKYVFIVGMNESIFPAKLQADPLIPERERKNLQDVLPLHSTRYSRDALHYLLGLQAATGKITISWSRFGIMNSRELFPSPFIYKSGQALIGQRISLSQIDNLPGYCQVRSIKPEGKSDGAISSDEYDQFSANLLKTPERIENYLKNIAKDLEELLAADKMRRTSELTAHQGILNVNSPAAAILKEKFGQPASPLAVTALEDYAGCPFNFYLKHILELKVIEEPEELFSLPPQQKGILLHRILELFYRQAAAQNILPAAKHPGECRKLLTDTCSRFLDQHEGIALLVHYPLVWQIQRRSLEEILSSYLEWEISSDFDGFVPVSFEKRFGYSGEPEQFKINLDKKGDLYLKGRVDRLDRSATAVRVIDYKTGKKKGRDNSFEGGTQLQLPLYLLAAGRLYNKALSEADSAHYYFLHPKDVQLVSYSGDGWDSKEKQLRKAVNALYSGIISGHYFPYPSDKGRHCSYCDYKTVCGPEIERMILFQKADDSLLQAFKVFKEELK